jgi:methionyl-tRNA formyltransferase
MRIAFAGTPEFAAQALIAILAAGHDVQLALTQPDRPAGRGLKSQPSAVKQIALRHGIKVYQPQKLKDSAAYEPIRAAAPDVMVVVAYGLILPQPVLDIPARGCINIHASLLPRWRGAAPIQRAIEAGDRETGVTIMRMDAGLDTGPMLLKDSLPILVTDTAATLHDKLGALGAKLIVDALAQFDQLVPKAQPAEGITHARKIDKAESFVDWLEDASTLSRKIRAFDPFPGMVATLRGAPIKLWQAVPTEGSGKPGTVLRADGKGLIVATGRGALCVTVVQKSGGKRMAFEELLRGFPIAAGELFDLRN